MPKPQVKQVLSGKVNQEVVDHVKALADAEGVRPSAIVNQRLLEVRTCDKMLARLPKDKRRTLPEIVALYVERNKNGG